MEWWALPVEAEKDVSESFHLNLPLTNDTVFLTKERETFNCENNIK